MSKGEATRQQILDRALALASETGLEALSIGTLAKEVGMSKSGLFAHFDSKENLQIQVLQTAAARFIEHVVSPALRQPRGEPRVRALFENKLAWPQSSFIPGGCLFMAAAAELDDRPGPVRDYLVGSQRDWFETLAHAARIAVREGHFRPDLDPEQLAYDFEAILLAYHHFTRLLRDPRAEERARNAFETLIRNSRP